MRSMKILFCITLFFNDFILEVEATTCFLFCFVILFNVVHNANIAYMYIHIQLLI